MGYEGEVRVHVDAPPEKVWSLISDLNRMGEWSPETYKVEWLDGANGPAVGAMFKGKNKRGIVRWSTKVKVIAFDAPRELAFATQAKGADYARWRYRIEPDGTGSAVTEGFEVLVVNRMFPEKRRRPQLIEGCQKTLQRIKAAAEAG